MVNNQPDILAEIIRHKAAEVADRTSQISLDELKARVKDAPPSRGFRRALERSIRSGSPGIIAEIKKASPSKGLIREHFDPVEIARSYADAGVTCLSVLTDFRFFKGSDQDLMRARAACSLPVLRKDFIVEPYQIWESRSIGADCILLIVAALTDEKMADLSGLAQDLNLDVLVEIHDKGELDRALRLSLPMIGVNNRNLKTFHTTLNTTLSLLPWIPSDRLIISESGINSAEDISHLRRCSVSGFLVGEVCMRADDPGQRIRELFFKQPTAVN